MPHSVAADWDLHCFHRSVCPSTYIRYDAECGKKALMPYVSSEGPDEGAHPCSLTLTFSVHQHVLQYLLIL